MQDDFWIDTDINPPAPDWYAAYVITIGWPSDDDYPESDRQFRCDIIVLER